jgi:hypothetical protein
MLRIRTTSYPVFSVRFRPTDKKDLYECYKALARAVLIRACRDVYAGDKEAAMWLQSLTGGLMYAKVLGIPQEAIYEYVNDPVEIPHRA